jgi:hypothetical protein
MDVNNTGFGLSCPIIDTQYPCVFKYGENDNSNISPIDEKIKNNARLIQKLIHNTGCQLLGGMIEDESLLKEEFFSNKPPQITLESPVGLIADFYKNAITPEQKRACLCYLLQYQHYNAEFSESECQQLGYPLPLYVPKKQHGYVRLDFNHLFQLVQPWITTYLLPFLNDPYLNEIKEYIKPVSSEAIEVLNKFFEIKFQDLILFCKNNKKVTLSKKDFIFIEIFRDEILTKKTINSFLEEKIKKLDPKFTLNDIIKPVNEKSPIPRFLFTIKVSNEIDCLLICGFKWNNNKKSFCCMKLEELFGSEALEFIGKMGAVPDRMAIHNFLTFDLDQALSILKLSTFDDNKTAINVRPDRFKLWHKQMEKLSGLEIPDSGIEIYRKAILRWNSCFFEQHNNNHLSEITSSLLCSQVLPFLGKEKGITHWVKAYQNVCEIVMFSLQYCLDLYSKVNFESNFLKALDLGNEFDEIYKSVRLFPYGMSALFHIFQNILDLNNNNNNNNTKLKLVWVSQNYFEIGQAAEKIKKDCIAVEKVDYLDDIKELPDILIVDFHPNNVKREEVFQNNVADWLQNQLDANSSKRIRMILDVTLNHLSDPEIKNTLQKLSPFVKEKRLEIFCIQSLAKFMQLGADNFSGGVCLYLGQPNTFKISSKFQLEQSPKSTFFGILIDLFKDIISDYLKLVRKNTEIMYYKLTRHFSNISKQVWIEDNKKKEDKNPFCAAKISLNADDGAVHVAISFKPLYSLLNIKTNDPKDEKSIIKIKEKYTENLKEKILELANQLKLPLAGRQSIGFSLSNMSHVDDAIRFSIGIENQELMEKYANLISDVIYILSSSIAKNPNQFNLTSILNDISSIYDILKEGECSQPCIVPLYDEDSDQIGNVNVFFKKHQLYLNIPEDIKGYDSLPKILHEPGTFYTKDKQPHLSQSLLIRFLFDTIFLNSHSMNVKIEHSYNDSFLRQKYFVLRSSLPTIFSQDLYEVNDEKSGISIQFEPYFSIKIPNFGLFYLDDVSIEMEDKKSGINHPKLKKLDDQMQSEIFTKCVNYHIKALVQDDTPKSVLLSFKEEKESMDYNKQLADLYKRGLQNVVDFLNQLNFQQLLPAKNQYWYSQEKPLDRLLKGLHSLGNYLAFKLTDKKILCIENINDEGCKKEIIRGIFEAFYFGSLEKKHLDSSVAEIFSKSHLSTMFLNTEIDNWIENIEAVVGQNKENEDNLQWLVPYLQTFFPAIKNIYSTSNALFDTYYSTHLHSLAEKAKATTCFPALKEYIYNLESEIPDYVKKINNYKSLTGYLRLYVYYRLTSEIQERLLKELHNLSVVMRNQWIDNPGFYYSPLEPLDLEYVDYHDDLILDKKQQKDIQRFFIETGCKNLLLKRLDEHNQDLLPIAFQWAVITDDAEILSQLIEFCNKNSLNNEILEQLQIFLTHLPDSFPKQLIQQEQNVSLSPKIDSKSAKLEKDEVEIPPSNNNSINESIENSENNASLRIEILQWVNSKDSQLNLKDEGVALEIFNNYFNPQNLIRNYYWEWIDKEIHESSKNVLVEIIKTFDIKEESNVENILTNYINEYAKRAIYGALLKEAVLKKLPNLKKSENLMGMFFNHIQEDVQNEVNEYIRVSYSQFLRFQIMEILKN